MDVLHEEAVRVDMATHMLQQGQNLRRERKTFKILNEALIELWSQHSERIINSSQLLEKVERNCIRNSMSAVSQQMLMMHAL